MFKGEKKFILLHILLIVYSFGGICSKFAAGKEFLSMGFLFFYFLLLLSLLLYAIGWQQIIKKLPLSTAFANKAITVVWGLVWGKIFFNEDITAGKLIGIGFIIIGIVLFSYSGKSVADER